MKSNAKESAQNAKCVVKFAISAIKANYEVVRADPAPAVAHLCEGRVLEFCVAILLFCLLIARFSLRAALIRLIWANDTRHVPLAGWLAGWLAGRGV